MEEIEPMYTEVEAARLVGVKPRSLRTERCAGRIGYKKVAGKVMYRRSDLVAWQRKGEPCLADGQTKAQSSFSFEREAGRRRSGTFGGARAAAAGSVQQALAIAEQLIKSSPGGFSNVAAVSKNPARAAPVIPLRPQ